jgi:hypothetical protein
MRQSNGLYVRGHYWSLLTYPHYTRLTSSLQWDTVSAIVGFDVGVCQQHHREHVRATKSFTEAVEATYATGLFEDDVFVDPRGKEGSAKLLIRQRAGVPLELSDIDGRHWLATRPVGQWNDLGDVFAAGCSSWGLG